MRAALLLAAATLGIIRVSEGAGHDPAQEMLMKADFCVAPDGKDTSPGTENQPFATLAGMREAVRRKIAAGLDHDPTPAQNFTLGLGHHTPRYFRGLLRDARIYCKTLSPAEVADLARSPGGKTQ